MGSEMCIRDSFLTAQQITSYFSRMAAKKKNVTEAEVQKKNLIRDVTAEITQRLVTEEEEQPVSEVCLLYTSPSPRDGLLSRMPSSA